MGFFPVDDETLRTAHTGRSDAEVQLVERYSKDKVCSALTNPHAEVQPETVARSRHHRTEPGRPQAAAGSGVAQRR